MKALLILKYIPTRSSDLKSDCLWSIIDGLDAEGVQVTLVTKGKSAQHEYPEVDHKSLCQYLENPDINPNPFTTGKPDVTFAICTSEYPAVLAHRIFEVMAIPYIVQEHRSIYDRQNLTNDEIPLGFVNALRDASAVYAVSAPLAKKMQMRGIRPDIGILSNSIQPNFFVKPVLELNTPSLADFFEWASSNYVFGAWTNWRSFKRVDLLLTAFKVFHNQSGKGRLIIAGPLCEPWDDIRVREYLKEHNLQNSVYLYGTADRFEIHAIAHRIDCCVIPSDFETFGLPALEAQAAGKPVVATKCGGPEDIVTDNSLGIIVPCNNAIELANGLLEIYLNQNRYHSGTIIENTVCKFSTQTISRKTKEALRLAYLKSLYFSNVFNADIISLKEANFCFRSGDYASAYYAYHILSDSFPELRVAISFNILLCESRMSYFNDHYLNNNL